ncbi:hypothetical protein DPMN_019620 [Dreissena polymorpha]|uniref:Uncharacterized protein n=1 Tax=Dreissena polymorpha TaxID=45954 RepID=A0A9D4S8D0_DREPO|nr:hypothetical protein DPMN_019620 [Dreissena polymorpha]
MCGPCKQSNVHVESFQRFMFYSKVMDLADHRTWLATRLGLSQDLADHKAWLITRRVWPQDLAYHRTWLITGLGLSQDLANHKTCLITRLGLSQDLAGHKTWLITGLGWPQDLAGLIVLCHSLIFVLTVTGVFLPSQYFKMRNSIVNAQDCESFKKPTQALIDYHA